MEEVAFEQRHESIEGGDLLRRAVQVEGAVAGRPEAASAGQGDGGRRQQSSQTSGFAELGFHSRCAESHGGPNAVE